MNDFHEQQEQRFRIKGNLEKFIWWHSKVTNPKLLEILNHRVSEYLLTTENLTYAEYEKSINYYNEGINEQKTIL